MIKTFTATASDGTVHSRNSKSFSFGFCVAYLGTTASTSWATDRAKAERVASQMRNAAAKRGCCVSGLPVEILKVEAA